MPVWTRLALLSAVVLTTLESILLQLKRAYFTGGFLAGDHLTSWAQCFGFIGLSLLSDFGMAAPLVVLGFWLSRAVGLSDPARVVFSFLLAVVPAVVADWGMWEITSFLGDTLNLPMMYELAGKSPRELFAVSSAHLVWPLAALSGAAITALALVIGLHRWGASYSRTRPVWTPFKLRPFVSLVVATTISAGVTAVARRESPVYENGLRRKPSSEIFFRSVDELSDVDFDGAGVLVSPPDPAPWDARIYPYAVEVPGNGIDEDGVAGDLPAGDEYRPAPISGHWAWRPPVVLIVLESFRADVVGAMREGRPVTPVLDALAARGYKSEHAFSHNGYTIQSRFHILSGSLAGAVTATTLVDDFKANGYEVGYFSAQDESFVQPGYAVGFDRASLAYDAHQDVDRRYSFFSTPGSLAVPAGVLLERLQHFLNARSSAAPLFLYVNFHDTHFPYHHRWMDPILYDDPLPQSEIRAQSRDRLVRTYANTAANVDRAVGQALDLVRAAVGGEPAVLVLADHGESLFEEGFLGHGYGLNDAQTRIPLIVSNLPADIPEPFGQVDLRAAIDRALSAPRTDRAPRPVARTDDGVFQYLGTISQPRQVTFVSSAGRVRYDFRANQFGDDGRWNRPPRPDEPGWARFASLVFYWERVRRQAYVE